LGKRKGKLTFIPKLELGNEGAGNEDAVKNYVYGPIFLEDM